MRSTIRTFRTLTWIDTFRTLTWRKRIPGPGPH